MKKILYVVCFIFVLSCSISGCKKNDKEISFDSIPVSEEYRQQDLSDYFIETEEIDYYMTIGNGGFIYFAEHGSHEFYKLCSKAECGHNDKNCNAYAGYALGYHDHKLYGVVDNGREFELISMNMDGTNHQKICNIHNQKSADGTTGGNGYDFYFHNGYMFYCVGPVSLDTTLRYFKVNLDTGETTELFAGQIGEYIGFTDERVAYKDKIYFEMSNIQTGESLLVEGNFETNSLKILMGYDTYNSRVTVEDDVLYYYKSELGFCEYDLNTGKETVVLEADYHSAQTVYTKDYIFAYTTDVEDYEECNYVLQIYDRDYNLIDQLAIEKVFNYKQAFRYLSSEAMYFSVLTTGEIAKYIDLNSIGTGKIQLTDIDNLNTR